MEREQRGRGGEMCRENDERARVRPHARGSVSRAGRDKGQRTNCPLHSPAHAPECVCVCCVYVESTGVADLPSGRGSRRTKREGDKWEARAHFAYQLSVCLAT